MFLDSLGLTLSRGRRSPLLLIVASVLVPLALFGIVAWWDRVVVLRDAYDRVDRGADSVREHALKVFQTDALVIALIDEHIKSMSWDEVAASRQLHDYMANLVAQYPELESAWIADASGTVRSSSRFFPARLTDVSGRDFFIAAREGKPLAFGGRVDNSFPDNSFNPHFYVARRRNNADGGFDGVIALSFSSSYFQKVWLASWHNAPHVVTTLTTHAFRILAREPLTRSDRLTAAPAAVAALKENPKAGALRVTSSADRVDRVAAYRRVDPYDAYVIYGVSFDSILRTWYQHLLLYGGIFGVAAIALTTLALRTARHMRALQFAMRDLAAETEKRHAAEKQLFEAEKLDAIGKVTSGFAHDFGNVLMAVQMNLDLVRSYIKTEGEEALHNASAEVERGSQAIRSLMAFARRGSLETQIVDTKPAIEQTSGLLQQAIGAHSTLDMSIDKDLWPIEVNANQLELALFNLAINARDAMPDGGKLGVAARNVSLSGTPDGLVGEFVEISVSDTGCGMVPEVAAKAIKPFFTTKDVGKGTGLGLSRVYDFAKDCGGTITLTSAGGQGTTVTLYIPKHSAPDQTALRSFKRRQSSAWHPTN